MTIYVNLFAGPGAGKSTTAAGVFHKLKLFGVTTELVTEFAKDLVWESRTACLGNQMYVMGEQFRRLHRLDGKVEVVVTDSPILLGMIYGKMGNLKLPDSFYDTMSWAYKLYSSEGLTYFLNRVKPFNPNGRNQSLEESRQIDQDIYDLLHKNDVNYKLIDGNEEAVSIIFDDVKRRLAS